MSQRWIRPLGLALLAVVVAPAALAQTVLDLPRLSQQATVSQRIGLTTLAITYSRPLVKGRKIWGGLVPYGEVWRAGADENTTLAVSDPVTIEGKPLPKGIYGLHMIPGESEWTIAFSRNATSWGSFTYDEKEDALRVAVKPVPAEHHEALTYEFVDPARDSVVATLFWEKLAIPVRVKVDVDALVAESLKQQLRAWSRWSYNGWDEAATFLLEHHGDLKDALAYADQSIQIEERFDNVMTRARVLGALGRVDEAAATRAHALEIGSVLQIHSYGRGLQFEGKTEEAFGIYRKNMARFPNHWLVRSEAARIACAKGDFDTAVREMKAAAAGAPEIYRAAFEKLVKRLEARENINE